MTDKESVNPRNQKNYDIINLEPKFWKWILKNSTSYCNFKDAQNDTFKFTIKFFQRFFFVWKYIKKENTVEKIRKLSSDVAKQINLFRLDSFKCFLDHEDCPAFGP